jgi:hypothetical protein
MTIPALTREVAAERRVTKMVVFMVIELLVVGGVMGGLISEARDDRTS